MKNNKFLMLVIFLMLLFVSACTPASGKKIVDIEADSNTFKNVVTINEFDLRTWFIQVNYNDDTYELVKVSFNMLSQEDFQKLSVVGTHEITFTYDKYSFVHELTIERNDAAIQQKLDFAVCVW